MIRPVTTQRELFLLKPRLKIKTRQSLEDVRDPSLSPSLSGLSPYSHLHLKESNPPFFCHEMDRIRRWELSALLEQYLLTRILYTWVLLITPLVFHCVWWESHVTEAFMFSLTLSTYSIIQKTYIFITFKWCSHFLYLSTESEQKRKERILQWWRGKTHLLNRKYPLSQKLRSIRRSGTIEKYECFFF